jgi:chromosome segregation ATPase
LLDQITLNDFTLNGLDIQLFLSLQEQLQAKEKELLTLQTTKDHLTKQIKELQAESLKLQAEDSKLKADIASLETKISSIDTGKIEQLKQEKMRLYEQQKQVEEGTTTFFHQHSNTISSLLQQSIIPLDKGVAEGGGFSLSDLYALIQTLKER